jgi:predicted  nucleic acid-binding Zn-ribbon protein
MAVTQNSHLTPLEEQLHLLLDLQDLDIEIMKLEDQREEIPKLIRAQDEIVEAAQRRLEDNDHLVNALEEELVVKNRLLGLQKIKKKNAKVKEKEASLDSLGQYEDFLKDVEAADLKPEEIETSIENLRHRIAATKEASKALRSTVGELDKQRKDEQKALVGKQAELDKELDAKYDLRDEMAENITENLLVKYELIADSKEGIGMTRAQDGQCLTCNMAIPPQMYNELMKRDRLMACPTCNRILVYIESERLAEEASETPKEKPKSKARTRKK